MKRPNERLLFLLAGVPVLVFVSAFLYMAGMGSLEGDPRTFWQSVEWAAETLSSVGYGGDNSWSHPLMVMLVVVVQFAGVFLIFLIFPVYLIPYLEERFEGRLPQEATRVSDHLIIFRYGAAVATLMEEARRVDLPTLVIESDSDTARTMTGRGVRTVFGRLEDGVLERVALLEARAMIANGSDDENAALILGARQLGFTGDILALVEEPYHRQPMMLAGATAAYTPRHVLAAVLAAWASRRVGPTVMGAESLGGKLRIGEARIRADSNLTGRTLGEVGIGARTGVTVIGQWVGGELLTSPTASMKIEPDGILVLAGSYESIERFRNAWEGTSSVPRSGRFLVAGYGEVGRKVVQLLRDAGEEARVVDRVASQGVDVVGDILDPGVLEEAGIGDSQAVILALDTDSAMLFATVIVKELQPEVAVVARVNRSENLERIHRAGADFARSISQVSGQILARRLLGEEAIALDEDLKVLKVSVAGLEGRHPAELGIRERTGCSVVAVERGEELLLELDADFRFRPDDDVYVCGSSDAAHEYLKAFERG